jgi:Cu/Ag efflux protein CusF
MVRIISAAVALMICIGSWEAVIAQAGLIDGEVTKVDQPANKITLRHGPIKKLGMNEGMMMVFAAKDPALLNNIKAGDKVKFDAERVNGQFTVTRIEKPR